MRTLGEAVGVEAMSLYNHVVNKEELLDGMVDLVFGEIDLPVAEPAGRRRCVSARNPPARRWGAILGRSA
jgi:AcrR family transcriptional regulator